MVNGESSTPNTSYSEEAMLNILIVQFVAGRRKECTSVRVGLREVTVNVCQFFLFIGLRACFIRHPKVRGANSC